MGSKEDARLLWRCRRGTRELDSLLVPYAVKRINIMGDLEKRKLSLLLEQQDPDLLAWFLGRTKPKNLSIASAIDNVLRFHNKRRNLRESASGASIECLEYKLDI